MAGGECDNRDINKVWILFFILEDFFLMHISHTFCFSLTPFLICTRIGICYIDASLHGPGICSHELTTPS